MVDGPDCDRDSSAAARGSALGISPPSHIPVNSVRGPTTEDLDMSLAKDIRLGGERGVNLQVQATNVTRFRF
jgi:hypothetical protein